MSNILKGKVAIVTGSARGNGKVIAMALASEGAQVVTNNLKPLTSGEDAAAVAKLINDRGGKAIPFFGDISNFQTAQKLIQTTIDNFGRIDILINNAGAIEDNLVWNMPEEEWDRVVNSSLKGSFNCIRHAIDLMIKQKWGRIINTTSAAMLGTWERCHYGAAKAGIVGLTKSVALDLSGYEGVTCNAYAPLAQTRMNTGPKVLAYLKRRLRAGALTQEAYNTFLNPPTAETLPPLLLYLCTDEASHITGKVFDVCGGNISIYSEPVKKITIYKQEGLWTIDELKKSVPEILLK